jgi:hypothetical protein
MKVLACGILSIGNFKIRLIGIPVIDNDGRWNLHRRQNLGRSMLTETVSVRPRYTVGQLAVEFQ